MTNDSHEEGHKPHEERGRLTAVVDGTNPTPIPAEADDTIEVWPHLVFIELIALLLVSAGLWLASLLIDPPLEEMASSAYTPKVAKAPWYFVGLQELLVYFDPWIAGVVLPLLIIVGLCAIPYLDRNKEHVGRWAWRQRPVGYFIFTFGLILWFGLIFVGEVNRGPNWSWYWPWESWDIDKPAITTAWSLPAAVGWPALLGYVILGTWLPGWRWPSFKRRLGAARYAVVVGLGLLMLAIPLKIFLRLVFDIRYIVETPWFSI